MLNKYFLVFVSGIIQGISWLGFDLPCIINEGFSQYIKIKADTVVLYSFIFYAAPNVVSSLFLGKFISKRNLNLVVFLTFLIFIGNVIFCFGVKRGNLFLMMTGKIIAGIGGEGFTINQNRIITFYFRGKELALALTALTIMGKLGTLFGFMFLPKFIEKYSGFTILFFYSCVSFLGFCLSFLICSTKKLEETKERNKESAKINISFIIFIITVLFFFFAWSIFHNSIVFILNNKYNFTNEKSCRLLGWTEISTILLSVFISNISDYYGYKLVFMNIGSVSALLGVFLIYFKFDLIYLISLLVSIGYSFFSCFWACIPLLINQIGFGYACIVCVINVSYCIPQAITSTFIDKDYDYSMTIKFIYYNQLLCIFFAVLMCYVNYRFNLRMNDPEIKKM